MKFSTRRALAAIVAATCLAIPASASAMPYSPPTTTKSDAAQSASKPTTDRTDAAQAVKDPRQADMHASTVKKPTFPPADFRGGDNPTDHPGMSGAPLYDAPTTIEVVRPERTIVRDVDQALPIALAGSALVLVLAMIGVTLVRTRLVPRPGRSH
jgi:hypothetical protein